VIWFCIFRALDFTNIKHNLLRVDEIRSLYDIMGTRLSGLVDLKITDLARDGGILTEARNQAISILETDPELGKPEHEKMRERIRRIMKSKPDWSGVS
jgi:ATP-dependent DNA helicase RecG